MDIGKIEEEIIIEPIESPVPAPKEEPKIREKPAPKVKEPVPA